MSDSQIMEYLYLGKSVREISRLSGKSRHYIALIKAKLNIDSRVPTLDVVVRDEVESKNVIPSGVIGKSTLYDSEGKIKSQWVREKTGVIGIEEMIAVMREGFGVKSGVSEPLDRGVYPGGESEGDYLTVYAIGDPHIGMYAWGEECGEDWDCNKAEKALLSSVHNLVSRSVHSGPALILNLGDFFHTDTAENKTRKSGNVLDVDTRWQKVMLLGVKMMREMIETALKVHSSVLVRNVIGNHDEQSSIMLSVALSLYYEGNPRVTIDISPGAFWYYRFGRVLIGSTHGDKTKPSQLGPIMANDRSEDWGNTDKRYWYIGHVHHGAVFEYPGCIVESFRTLAPKDAWHAGKGYRSDRDMYSITLHKKWGEVGRTRFDLAMIG